jgi:hypothetical protein
VVPGSARNPGFEIKIQKTTIVSDGIAAACNRQVTDDHCVQQHSANTECTTRL